MDRPSGRVIQLPPPIPLRIGRYEIQGHLGSGGMGVVYLATDPLLQRTVAIKVLPVNDDDLRARFAREARSAAALRHPNVVTIYDVGEDGGNPFIAMEFLDGESIAELVSRRAPLSVDRRLQLVLELCAGLGYAHKNGIVHRDIKPGNLMVIGEGTLKILDFGLARFTNDASGPALTQVGSVLGSPHYMSPEQVEGKIADARSDIFSVGVVLYELLTFQKAYPGGSTPVVLHNIVHLAPTPIRELLPSIDSELEAIVNKALEKDPAKRYQDLNSLAAALTHVRAKLIAAADSHTLITPGLGEPTPQRAQSPNRAQAHKATPPDSLKAGRLADSDAHRRELVTQRVKASRAARARGDLAEASAQIHAGLELAPGDPLLLAMLSGFPAAEPQQPPAGITSSRPVPALNRLAALGMPLWLSAAAIVLLAVAWAWLF